MMKSNKTVFSVKTTFGILLFLIIPFLIRSSAPALEPYPAIVLPLGIGLYDIGQNTIDVKTTKIWGMNEDGEWVRIKPSYFLEPIPVYYLSYIVNNNLGLKKIEEKKIRTAFWGEVMVPRKKIGEEEIESTKKWVKERLDELGYQNSKIRATRGIKTVELETDHVISEEIVEEQIYILD